MSGLASLFVKDLHHKTFTGPLENVGIRILAEKGIVVEVVYLKDDRDRETEVEVCSSPAEEIF